LTEPTTHREVELKFRVHPLFTLPDLSELASRVEEQPPINLVAVYHDTEALTLFRWRVTMRRREGGLDAGWHLKLPVADADEGVRDELHAPLSAGQVGQVPAELVDIIAPLIQDQALSPVVELRTRRTPHIFYSDEGLALIELVDDTVQVLDHNGEIVSVFREIEVELQDHNSDTARHTMTAACDALLTAGAVPGSTSKAASALGPRASAPADVPELPMPSPSGMAADAIRATIANHVRALIFADVGVRRNLPDSVHQVRVSARRLRSVLRTVEPLLDREWSAGLSAELAWLADEMGLIRDSEVLEKRLLSHIKLIPVEDGHVASAVIKQALDRRIEVARQGALAAIRSDRHTYLIQDLIEAARAPQLLNGAYQACEDVLPELVAKTWRVLRKSCGALEISGPAPEWHAARIKAKRARYAVDCLTPIFGGKVAKFGKSLAAVTEVLGDHQDAFVAQEFLRELAYQDSTNGSAGYALGLLHGVELEAEMDSRFEFVELWEKARHAAQNSGLIAT
jgi:CHAD domain-containing protein